MLDDMEAFGVTNSSIEEAKKELERQSVVRVIEKNRRAVEIVLAGSFEKIISPSGKLIYTSMDRVSLPIINDMLGFNGPIDKETFLTIRVFEHYCINELNK